MDENYSATAIGRKTSLSPIEPGRALKELRLLPLIWKLIQVFFKYGNLAIYYHICGSHARDSWDCPMDAEGLEIRHTACGPKLTLW